MATNEQKSLPAWLAENMRPPAAAEYLGVSESQLAKLRMLSNRDRGPPFSKVGGVIIYTRTNLDEWIRANAVK